MMVQSVGSPIASTIALPSRRTGKTSYLFAISTGMSLRTPGSTSSEPRSTPRTRNWRSSIIVIVADSTKPSSIRL